MLASSAPEYPLSPVCSVMVIIGGGGTEDVAVRVGFSVGLGVLVGVGVPVRVGVNVGLGVLVGVSVGLSVAVGEGVAVWVGVSVGLGVLVGVDVAVGVGEAQPSYTITKLGCQVLVVCSLLTKET